MRAVLVFLAVIAGQGSAAAKPSVASINVCTDQLVLALADPEQIVGLSPYSRDAARSWLMSDARLYRRLSGEAEDILVLKPDLVVAGRFTKRATRELLKEKGHRVVEFDAARSVEAAETQVLRMGDLIDQKERAAAWVVRLREAVRRTREAAARQQIRVLPVSRRGWVSGSESLMSSLLSTAGLANAAGELGFRTGGFASLERIVATRPDFLLVSESRDEAEDQGRAFLLHPALERLYPPAKRFIVPEALTVCGGPMLVEALERLAAEVARASR